MLISNTNTVGKLEHANTHHARDDACGERWRSSCNRERAQTPEKWPGDNTTTELRTVRCCMHQLQLWTLIYSGIAADACNAHAILQLGAPLYQIATAPRIPCSMLPRRVQYVCNVLLETALSSLSHMLVRINSNAVVNIVSMVLNALGMHRPLASVLASCSQKLMVTCTQNKGYIQLPQVNDHAQLLQVQTMPHEV